MQPDTQQMERPPDPPGSGGPPSEDHPGSAGYLAATLGFAGGWIAGFALAQAVARSIVSSANLDGFSGLALAMSIGGLLRIGIVALSVLGCFFALKVRKIPFAGATAILSLGAWWVVTASLHLILPTGFGLWQLATAVSLVTAPSLARAATRRLAFRSRRGATIGVALIGLVACSVLSTGIGGIATDRALDRFKARERQEKEIDFTPYLPTEIPRESEGERVVFGPITPPPSISLAYGDLSDGDDPHRFFLNQFRALAAGCNAEALHGDRLSCEQVGELTDGTPVRVLVEHDGAESVWIAKDTTVIVMECLLEADQGCIRDDGSLNPQTIMVLDSLEEAVYTAPEPLSGDDPVIELASA